MILEQVETLENKELCDEYSIVETDTLTKNISMIEQNNIPTKTFKA